METKSLIFVTCLSLAAIATTPSGAARYRGYIENSNNGYTALAYDNQYQCEEESRYGNSCTQIHNNCGGEPLWTEGAYAIDWSDALESTSSYLVIERFDDIDEDGVYDYGPGVCTIGQGR